MIKWRYDRENATWFCWDYEICKVAKGLYKLLKYQQTVGWFKKLKHAKHVAELIHDENY